MAGVAEVCPIDLSETIEGWPAHNGAIRPNLDPRTRPKWAEAFFLITHKTRLSYTLEAPVRFPHHDPSRRPDRRGQCRPARAPGPHGGPAGPRARTEWLMTNVMTKE